MRVVFGNARIASFVLVIALVAIAVPRARASTTVKSGKSTTASTSAARDTAVFAGGCFWCMETAYEERPGVISATSGYTGGRTKNPSYEEVCSHTTGHLEAVQVVFDPRKISYDQLLDVYWHSIDPTQADGQMADKGESYLTAIFYRNEGQKRAAEATKKAIERSGVLKGKPIVTTIRPAGPFYPAENYHQDFYEKDPLRYTTYRMACGRDARLNQIWGDKAAKPSAH